MFYYDPTFILLIPALILTIYAQSKVHSTFRKYHEHSTNHGITGKEVASKILKSHGIHNVTISKSLGYLSDHYNPISKELKLSPDVYDSDSVSAVGVAAHEAGHALQHAQKYFPLHIRTVIYPAVSFSSYLAPILILVSFFIQSFGLLKIGILLYAIAVLFTVITLPVEFDASRRALAYLKTSGILTTTELNGCQKVLSAAALTYIAAALTAILELVRLLLIARRQEWSHEAHIFP